MRTFLLLVLFQLTTGGAIAQPLPNGSFEQWSIVGAYDSLHRWISNNSTSFVGVKKDSILYYDGSRSSRILTNGVLSSPLVRPGFGFGGAYCRVTIVGADTVSLQAISYSNGVAIDSSIEYITSTSSGWGLEVLWFSPQADTIRLVFRGGHIAGTTFNVDKAVIVNESVPDITNKIQARLAPNPMREVAVFRFRNPAQEPYSWRITNAIGQTVLTQQHITGDIIPIERKGLPPGTYSWELWSEREPGRAAGRLTLQ